MLGSSRASQYKSSVQILRSETRRHQFESAFAAMEQFKWQESSDRHTKAIQKSQLSLSSIAPIQTFLVSPEITSKRERERERERERKCSNYLDSSQNEGASSEDAPGCFRCGWFLFGRAGTRRRDFV